MPTEADLKQLLKEYVEQTDAQIAEISALKEENARLHEARAEPEASSDVVDLGADEQSRSLAARASSMDKQTLVAMAKQKIDEEETANAKLKEAMAAMEETHHEERTKDDRRVADVRAAKRDARYVVVRLTLRKGAERTRERAHVGVVDVPVRAPRHCVAALRRAARVRGGAGGVEGDAARGEKKRRGANVRVARRGFVF